MDKLLSLGAETDTGGGGGGGARDDWQKIRRQTFNSLLPYPYSPWWVVWSLLDLSAWPAPWVHQLVPSDLAWPGPAPCPCLVPGLRAVAEAQGRQRQHQAALAWLLMSGLVVEAGSSVPSPRLSGHLGRSVVPIL